jgi:hypothetical protein
MGKQVVVKTAAAPRAWGKGKTMKLMHAFEQLDAIEKATGAEKVSLLKDYGSKSPLSFVVSLNFRSDVTLDLPEGMPPMEPNEMDTVTHPDMMGALSTTVHRLKNCMPTANIKQFKKEEIFVQVLLACPMKDAEILCAAKDKALEELYPSITADLVKSVFPAYVK